MKQEELLTKIQEIDSSIKKLEDEKKTLAAKYGVAAIIARMKENDCDTIYIRDAGDNGFIDDIERLWFSADDGFFAAKILKLNNDQLTVVYTTVDQCEGSYECSWDYGDEEMSAVVDEEIAKNLISQILCDMLDSDDELYQDFREEEEW